jgi:hypothetical protein
MAWFRLVRNSTPRAGDREGANARDFATRSIDGCSAGDVIFIPKVNDSQLQIVHLGHFVRKIDVISPIK